jgi:hypothetical protein
MHDAAINPNEPLSPAVDYAVLLDEGTTITQALSGGVWTNYNESDPGVTALEQLCYALTELGYRADLPIENLLLDRPGGHINPRRQALYPARRIFPCNPVTLDDYRKLLLDRIASLGNVWIEPHRVKSKRSVNGLYDVTLYVPSLNRGPCTPIEPIRELRDEVRRVYNRHRNLCEDLRAIRIVRQASTGVQASVDIGDAQTAETTLADLLFRLGIFLAPEPRRCSLQSLLDAGMPPSAIFNGPLLLHGFINDDQLAPKACVIRLPDVIRGIAGNSNVLGIRGLSLTVMGKTYAGNDRIRIPPNVVLQLETNPSGIRLFRNGLEVKPDNGRVQRELAKLWANQRRRYSLSSSYDTSFGFPKGKYGDVERYYAVQNQFPNVYGINAYGLEPNASEMHRAQAKQLKAYLLVFEQLMANFLAQLAHVRDLYSTEEAQRETYFFQTLECSVPNVAPLLAADYRSGLARIVREGDPVVARRNRFLDFLLALYGESLDLSSIWDLGGNDAEDPDAGMRLIRAKVDLLRHLVASTHNRGRGVDVLERPSRGNMAGMETKIRIQLGMDAFDQQPLCETLDQNGITLAGNSPGQALTRHGEIIDLQFESVSLPAASPHVSRPMAVPQALLRSGIDELRIGQLAGESSFAVVRRTGNEWRLVDKHPDRETAVAAAREFAGVVGLVRKHCQQFYVVEHTLLRSGRFRAPGPFVYDFTATVVFSPPSTLRSDDDYKSFVSGIVRENTPAHIVVSELFLTPSQMTDFEPLYWAWRHALRCGERPSIVDTSIVLREFLAGLEGNSR